MLVGTLLLDYLNYERHEDVTRRASGSREIFFLPFSLSNKIIQIILYNIL